MRATFHRRHCPKQIRPTQSRLFAIVEPINTYAVVGVGVLRYLEHIVRSAVVKFHDQSIRREDVVGDVTAPLSGDVIVRQAASGCLSSYDASSSWLTPNRPSLARA